MPQLVRGKVLFNSRVSGFQPVILPAVPTNRTRNHRLEAVSHKPKHVSSRDDRLMLMPSSAGRASHPHPRSKHSIVVPASAMLPGAGRTCYLMIFWRLLGSDIPRTSLNSAGASSSRVWSRLAPALVWVFSMSVIAFAEYP